LLEELRDPNKRVVGTKETLKAVNSGLARKVFIAVDADKKISEPVRKLCLEKKIPLVEVRSKEALGKACGIKVGAAAAALLLAKSKKVHKVVFNEGVKDCRQ
jgi:large subunit ribosomal protein L7A